MKRRAEECRMLLNPVVHWLLVGFSCLLAGASHAAVETLEIQPSVIYVRESQVNPADYDYSFIASPGLLKAGKPGVVPEVTPMFRTNEQSWTVSVKTEAGTSLYGTGETAGRLLRNGKKTVCWNSDAWQYNRGTTSLYQSFPWVLAVRADGTAFGVLADTTRKCTIDLTDGIRFTVKNKPFPVIVITGKTPQEVVSRLSGLVGRTPLPPLWALGYQQSRWSYMSEAAVTNIASTFRAKHIPCDVIWMDIDYMDGFRVFTFNTNTFPDPKRLNEYLHGINFKAVWMIDPGVKVDNNYGVYAEGSKQDVWVKSVSGKPFVGKVWPGDCVFPDFTAPGTRAWWAGHFAKFMALGIDGVWNDMNEPSVFGGPGGTMPLDNLHAGGDGIPAGKHEQYHNVYGMLMAQSTFEGIQKAEPDKRPFVLSRANYIGGNKTAACWTGDNTSNWEHLEDSVSMSLNLGLSGQPFCGPDIGGFLGNGDAGMYEKWIAVGALLPFSRGHAAKDTRQKEPWAWGEQTEDIARVALQRRYRLMPYLYTLFHEASVSGLPVMRPVFFADPADATLRAEDKAFLLGADLLVIPSVTKAPASITIPKGIWAPLVLVDAGRETDQKQPALRIRGGSIIPAGKIIESTEENSFDPLTLYVCLDANGTAEGSLYEDAGNGYGYRKGDYRLTTFKAVRENGKIRVFEDSKTGKRKAARRRVAVVVVGQNGETVQSEGDLAKGVSFACALPVPVPAEKSATVLK